MACAQLCTASKRRIETCRSIEEAVAEASKHGLPDDLPAWGLAQNSHSIKLPPLWADTRRVC
jgi:hypothetical protein